MAGRGKYAKGVAKREEILRTALDVFAVQGYRGTSLRELAEAVNLSQAGVLHYFESKEELFAEILRKRDERDNDEYSAGGDVIGTFGDVMRHNAEVPGFVSLYANVSAAATEPDHPAHAFFVDRYEHMRHKLAEGVRARQAAGAMAADLDPEKIASVVLAAADGLQVQWLLKPEQDMADHLEYLWAVLSRVSIHTAEPG
ncbi:MAG: TetR/AcrR family transcriptional regulator [Actinomycetota bacterium]|nr:TetR/AcrR family transcriptional regulator [Actinomycetota bacterium]